MRKSTLNQFSFRRSNILFTLTTPFSNAVWSIWIIIWWFFNWWFWTWIIIRFAKNTSISRTISLIQYRSHHITHCRVHNIAHTISHNSLDIAPCLNTRDFHWIVYFGILFASSNWYYNLRRRFSFVFYCTIHWCNSCIVCFYWLHAIVLRFVTVRTKYITFTIVFKQYGVSKKKGLRISKDREMTDCGFNIDFNMLFILFQDV